MYNCKDKFQIDSNGGRHGWSEIKYYILWYSSVESLGLVKHAYKWVIKTGNEQIF